MSTAPKVGPPLIEERALAEVLRTFRRSLSPAEADELDRVQEAYDIAAEEFAMLRADLKAFEPSRTLAERIRTPEPEPLVDVAAAAG